MKDNNQEVKKGSNATANQVVQKKSTAKSLSSAPVTQLKENNTGLPDNLKSGVENLSGHSMDDVKVHYNSAQPVQLNAHAYAQGSEIHVAPGQDQHLPHEAWHVAQQKQGRVQPTAQMKSKNVNDDSSLEKEADVMGQKAASQTDTSASDTTIQAKSINNSSAPIQRMTDKDRELVQTAIPKTHHVFLAWAMRKKEAVNPLVEPAMAGKHFYDGTTKAIKAGSENPIDTFSGKQKEAAEGTMGLGDGSKGVLGAIGATAGLAVSVGGGAAQIYGAYGDQQDGKFDTSKGGKGVKSMATGAGRGLNTAAGITTGALQTTQAIASITGNAGAFGAAAAGLGPMAMITAGFQGVKGLHNAKLNSDREASAEKLGEKATDPKQKELFKDLAENKKDKKHKGWADAALGAGGMIAAGLMLNPVTAPAGLAIGAALGLGQGVFALFKAIRQKGRNEAAIADKKAEMKPEQIIDAKKAEYKAAKEAGTKSWNPFTKLQAYRANKKLEQLEALKGDDLTAYGEGKSAAYKKTSERLNNVFDKEQSSDKQKEKKNEMAKGLQSLPIEMQQEAMQGVMGVNKYEKNEDGSVAMSEDPVTKVKSPKTTQYFQNQIFNIQDGFVKKMDPQIVYAKAAELSRPNGENDTFTDERSVTKMVASSMGMDEGAAERELLTSKM